MGARVVRGEPARRGQIRVVPGRLPGRCSRKKMEGEGGSAAGRAMAQNVEDGLEGMPQLPSDAPQVSLSAGAYPHDAPNTHMAAVRRLVSTWHTQQGLPEDATLLACAEQAGHEGSAWSILAILALFQSVHTGQDGMSQVEAAERVLALDHSKRLRLALETGKEEGTASTGLSQVYTTFINPGAKAAAWWVNDIEAWKRGGSGRAGQALASSRLC